MKPNNSFSSSKHSSSIYHVNPKGYSPMITFDKSCSNWNKPYRTLSNWNRKTWSCGNMWASTKTSRRTISRNHTIFRRYSSLLLTVIPRKSIVKGGQLTIKEITWRSIPHQGQHYQDSLDTTILSHGRTEVISPISRQNEAIRVGLSQS